MRAHQLETHAGLDGGEDSGRRGNVELLPRVGEMRVEAADSLNGGLQVQEAPLLHRGHNLRTEAIGHGGLVRDHQPAGLLDGCLDRVRVPGDDRLQVDDFAGDALLGRQVRGLFQAPHLGAPADERDVLPLPHDLGLAYGQLVVARGHLGLGAAELVAVEDLRLKEQHGVRVPDGSQEQPLGLAGPARHHDLQARAVGEEGLGALAVVHAAVADRGAGCADRDVRGAGAAAAVPVLGDLIHNLVESREDVVRKLHLCDGAVACHGEANSESCDCLLRHRGIQHAVSTVLLAQADGAAEHTAEGDVLAEEHRLLVGEGNGECLVDGGHHGELLRGPRRRGRLAERLGGDPPGVHRGRWPVKIAIAVNVEAAGVLPDVLLYVRPLLLQVPGQLIVHVGEEVLEWRPFLGLPRLESLHDLLPGLGHQCFLLLVVPHALGREEVAPPENRTSGLVRRDLLLVLSPVRGGVVRGRVVAHAVGHQLQQHGRLLLDGKAACLRGGVEDGHKVVTVHTDGWNPKRRPTSSDAIPDILVLDPRGNGVAVVPHNEQRLRAVDGREVQGRERVALRGGAVAKVGH
mmetsp:Transcript_59143/g.183465  ORF Transcript_59143/g.183465 Transcript_59143/m.183465 type:complete len:574 (-) Transcript_59143:764-2485(-)